MATRLSGILYHNKGAQITHRTVAIEPQSAARKGLDSDDIAAFPLRADPTTESGKKHKTTTKTKRVFESR